MAIEDILHKVEQAGWVKTPIGSVKSNNQVVPITDYLLYVHKEPACDFLQKVARFPENPILKNPVFSEGKAMGEEARLWESPLGGTPPTPLEKSLSGKSGKLAVSQPCCLPSGNEYPGKSLCSEKSIKAKSVTSGNSLNAENTISEKITEAWAALSDKSTKSYNDLTSGKADTLLIGFDTEWDTMPDNSRLILSYQFSVIWEDYVTNVTIFFYLPPPIFSRYKIFFIFFNYFSSIFICPCCKVWSVSLCV